MSLFETYRAYRSLDPQQRSIIRTGYLDGEGTADQWLKILTGIARYDRHGDALRPRAGCLGALVLVVGLIAGGYALSDQARHDPTAQQAAIYLGPLLILAGIFGLLVSGSTTDVSNHLREFLVPLVRILREDLPGDRPFPMKIDLRGSTLPAKRNHVQKHDPGWFSYPKVTLEFFEDSWCAGQARLTDGSGLSWEITDRVRKRTRQQKNARGKVKTKVKYRVKRRVEVTVAVKASRYQLSGAAGEGKSPVHSRVEQVGDRVVFKLRRVLVHQELDPPMPVRVLLDLLQRIYDRVKPTARGAS